MNIERDLCLGITKFSLKVERKLIIFKGIIKEMPRNYIKLNNGPLPTPLMNFLLNFEMD